MLKRSGFDSENGESRSWKRKHILYTCVPRKPRFAFLCSKEALGRGLIIAIRLFYYTGQEFESLLWFFFYRPTIALFLRNLSKNN